MDTLDENAPWTRTAREGTERKRNGNGRDGTETEGGKRRDKPARQDVSHEAGSLLFSWLSSGFGAEAPKAADQGSPGERVSLRGGGSGGVVPDALAPRGEVPGAKKAGGRQKPALGLASRVREVVQEEEGGRLQEVLEKEALAAELEPGKDRVVSGGRLGLNLSVLVRMW